MRKLALLIIIALMAVSAFALNKSEMKMKGGKWKVRPSFNDKVTMIGTGQSGREIELPKSGETGAYFDKSANGYGWYQGYSRKISWNADPATGSMVGSIYRKLAPATGSGTIGGMIGEWIGVDLNYSVQTVYDESNNWGSPENPGSRYPYSCGFINGYSFGIFNDFNTLTFDTNDSYPMFSVADATFGYDFSFWNTGVVSKGDSISVPGAWTGTGDVVYDSATGYYYWSQVWNQDLANLGDYIISCIAGRSTTPADVTSWEWSDYQDLTFDSADDTSGLTDIGNISWAYCKDTSGNGTGYGIAVAMANDVDDLAMNLNPRISYMYTTDFGGDTVSGDWSPNWVSDIDNKWFQIDPADLFDWYGSTLTEVDTMTNDTTVTIINDPLITWNISAVATENNYVHLLLKVFGGTYEGVNVDNLLYANDDDFIAGYYHVKGEITGAGVNWSQAHLVASLVGVDTGEIEYKYTNSNILSMGYAGDGHIYATWLDRSVTGAVLNPYQDGQSAYIDDGYVSFSSDGGNTWVIPDGGHTQVEVDTGQMFNLYYAENVTNTPNLHEEGWSCSANGRLENDKVEMYVAHQYYDEANHSPDVFGFSDYEQFLHVCKIKETLDQNNIVTVTLPSGGEILPQSTQYEITWSDNLDENVKIELYQNSLYNSDIVLSTPSDGSYFWNIPDSLGGNNFKIKIVSTENSLVFDLSYSSFTIIDPIITIISPNGLEEYQSESNCEITWNSAYVFDNVRIELYKDSLYYSDIISSTPCDGSYIWNIPDSLGGSDFKINIVSTENSAINDFSDGYFTIIPEPVDYIEVISPNGGEELEKGSNYEITWVDNITENVKIELHRDSLYYSDIISSTDSTSSYIWTIADSLLGSDFSVKIVSTVDSAINDFSDGYFTIIPEPVDYIEVISPNGGEELERGSNYEITWIDDITENVKIELYRDSLYYSDIISSTDSTSSYIWTIADSLLGSDFSVKIVSTVDSAIHDFSDGYFTIIPEPVDYIEVISPNGGEELERGSNYEITWIDDITENVKIELYRDSLYYYDIISSTPSDSTSSYIWTIADSLLGSDFRINIVSTATSAIHDFSDGYFTIIPEPVDYIEVISPNGGEELERGSNYEITWVDNITENVKIELYRDSLYYSDIISSTDSTSSYIWTIADSLLGSDFRINIVSTATSAINDFSDGYFTIIPEPVDYIEVISPNGGEELERGSNYEITWIDDITENVKIELYRDGLYYYDIISSTPSDSTSSYIWTIADSLLGSDFRINIVSTATSAIHDFSDGYFAIIPEVDYIEVISPNGGEELEKGSNYEITWVDNITENVKIELYQDSLYYYDIISSTPSDSISSYIWTIADSLLGSDFRINIVSTATSAIHDFSDGYFTIIPEVDYIEVISPNGGEVLGQGELFEITWTDNIDEDVRIELYQDSLYHSDIIGSTPSDSSYEWTVPSLIGSNFYIKIVSPVDSMLYDCSDGSFAITQFSDGDGTEGDPYHVANVIQLNNTRNYISSYFIQTADIDLDVSPYDTGEGWEPIGNATLKFTGNYDGGNYTISNLFINRPSSDYIGLFGYIESGAEIFNLYLENVDIIGFTGIGSIAGRIASNTNIFNCSASGNITGIDRFAGGVVGMNYGSIERCRSSVNLNTETYAGGFVGYNTDTGEIQDSYSIGDAFATSFAGGFIGYNKTGLVTNCYSTGSASGNENVGGFIGSDLNGVVTSCYWDTEISGNVTSAAGTSKTTAEMQIQSTFVDWDFTALIWTMHFMLNNGFPYLKWEGLIQPTFYAPQNITSKIEGNYLEINWDIVPDAVEYEIYSSDDPYGGFTFIASVITNRLIVLPDQARAFYHVIALDEVKAVMKIKKKTIGNSVR